MRRFVVAVPIGLALVAALAVGILLTREPDGVRQDVSAEFVVQPGETPTFAPGDVLPADVILCVEHRTRLVVPEPGFAEVIAGVASVTTWPDGSVTAECSSILDE